MNPMMIGLGLQAFGAINGAIGSFYSAKNAKAQLAFQSQMAELNARIAERNAQAEMQRGAREVQSSRLKTAQLKSAQRVGLAANGIDLASGSAQNIFDSTDIMGEIDAITIEANAIRSAWGYRTQGVNEANQGLISGAASRGISPFGSAATSLLGSAGQVAQSWYLMGRGGDSRAWAMDRMASGSGSVGDM